MRSVVEARISSSEGQPEELIETMTSFINTVPCEPESLENPYSTIPNIETAQSQQDSAKGGHNLQSFDRRSVEASYISVIGECLETMRWLLPDDGELEAWKNQVRSLTDDWENRGIQLQLTAYGSEDKLQPHSASASSVGDTLNSRSGVKKTKATTRHR